MLILQDPPEGVLNLSFHLISLLPCASSEVQEGYDTCAYCPSLVFILIMSTEMLKMSHFLKESLNVMQFEHSLFAFHLTSDSSTCMQLLIAITPDNKTN